MPKIPTSPESDNRLEQSPAASPVAADLALWLVGHWAMQDDRYRFYAAVQEAYPELTFREFVDAYVLASTALADDKGRRVYALMQAIGWV